MDPEWLKQILGPLVQVLMARQQGPNFVEQGLRGAMATQGTPLPQMSPEARQQATQSLQGAGEMVAGLTPFDAPLAAVLAARDLRQGNWMGGAMNAAGILPFVPPLGAAARRIADKTPDLASLREAADIILVRGGGQAAMLDDAGEVWTRKQAAEHGDLSVWAKDMGATFDKIKPTQARGWIVGGKFYSLEDLEPALIEGVHYTRMAPPPPVVGRQGK